MLVKKYYHNNQYIISNEGTVYFQSYKSLIASVSRNKVTLYKDWDYSRTTLRHLYLFLKEYSSIDNKFLNKKGIEKLIKEGTININK